MMWQQDSAAVPAPADRIEWFTEAMSSGLMPLDFTIDRTVEFHAEAALLDLGTVRVSRISHSFLRSRRTRALIRREDPEQYQLGLVTGGSMSISQSNGESVLLPGDMALWDTSRPFQAGVGGSAGMEAFVVQIPKGVLPLRADRIDRILAQRISAGSGMGAIFAQFVTALAGHGSSCTPQDRVRLGATVVDLAATCLAQQLGALHEAPADARACAMFERIDAFIEQNLADSELTPRVIAERHHLSLRGLYNLFERSPEGVAASIRRRRLERCRADLANPELEKRPVQAVAARWGFTDAAVFSRAFRDACGLTPTEYRHQALRGALHASSRNGARVAKA
ncbi:helix-turn-helix domain-containing protein [Kitasatospora sp. NPDC008050]|uniref:AraC-like ligand-binding domain-containing protein n=1 Tax=Kitasatospora sp. NPDC008050 TaxID=3364021 RepID=UPI0036EDE2BB